MKDGVAKQNVSCWYILNVSMWFCMIFRNVVHILNYAGKTRAQSDIILMEKHLLWYKHSRIEKAYWLCPHKSICFSNWMNFSEDILIKRQYGLSYVERVITVLMLAGSHWVWNVLTSSFCTYKLSSRSQCCVFNW